MANSPENGPDPEIYRRVFANNQQWVARKTSGDAEFFQRLSYEQRPSFFYIGCADSRVPANEIMGLDAGEVFVHRNVANLVVNTDLNGQAALQYAVEHLHVKHVVVCGHYGCGGVKAAMQRLDLGLLNGWLREIRDVCRMYYDELCYITDDDRRFRRLVELNVREQCNNVIKTAVVQKHYQQYGFPTVHGWVYDLHDGLLRDLKIPFEHVLEGIREVYELDFPPPESCD